MVASGYSSIKFGRRIYSSLRTLYLIQQVLSLRSFSFQRLDYSLLRGIISEMVWNNTKKKHDLHPRFGPGSVPTFVINTTGAGLLDPSALNRDDKSPSCCGLFYSQGNKYLVPDGQDFTDVVTTRQVQPSWSDSICVRLALNQLVRLN